MPRLLLPFLGMTDGGAKGRSSRGRGQSSRGGGRGRGAEPPPSRRPQQAEEALPAHNNEPASADPDDEEYLALAASITHMMRDEVASRDSLTKRVSELEGALTAAQHGHTPPLVVPELSPYASSGRAWGIGAAGGSYRGRSRHWVPSHFLVSSSGPRRQNRSRRLHSSTAFSFDHTGSTQGDG